jgi:hypothetical protein
MKPRLKIGDMLKVWIDDHAEAAGGDNDEKAQGFYVMGVLIAKSRKELVVRSWGYEHDEAGPSDDNTHQWVVARKASTKVRVLIERED